MEGNFRKKILLARGKKEYKMDYGLTKSTWHQWPQLINEESGKISDQVCCKYRTEEYLINIQHMQLNNEKSEILRVICGSVPGPKLFIIYNNYCFAD